MQRKILHEADDYTSLFERGEEKGFTWFFHQLYPALTLYCYKITGDKEASEEIASNAFIKIWGKHEMFSDVDSIKAYLYRIVRNDALKHLKKEQQSISFTKEVIYLYASEHEKDCFNSLVATEITNELHQAINSLPAECKKVFRLMYVEGKSVHETASALQLSPSTVKTQKARGLATLRKTLDFKILFLLLTFTYFSVFHF